MHWLDPVRAALDERTATVFFRDDDAGWDDGRLLALLDRFDAHDLPLDLAVIPAALHPPLADELTRRVAWQRLNLHQHGYRHENHEAEGRKYEFGPSRSITRQREDIVAGAARLEALLDDLPQPIFTPPWNRCTQETAWVLREFGFAVLSREARATKLDLDGLDEIPIRVDWVKPDRVGLLATAIADGGRIGVMLHHAVMDPDDLARTDELLALLAAHPHVEATGISG
jgi:uncharacterized protein DUF2334